MTPGHQTAARVLRSAGVVTACFLLLVPIAGAQGATARAGTPPRVAPAAGQRPTFTEADVRFMQGMIVHHAQAVDMAALVPSRTERREIRMLAERIDVSQQDEIRMMKAWLADRGQPVATGDHARHDMPGEPMRMPGMLSPEQMAQLSGARGAEFDRLFLTFMIQHHEGAIVMVKDLFAAPGAGQETRIFLFATDVDADQRAEIARMRALLGPA